LRSSRRSRFGHDLDAWRQALAVPHLRARRLHSPEHAPHSLQRTPDLPQRPPDLPQRDPDRLQRSWPLAFALGGLTGVVVVTGLSAWRTCRWMPRSRRSSGGRPHQRPADLPQRWWTLTAAMVVIYRSDSAQPRKIGG